MNMLLPLTSLCTIRRLWTCFRAMQSWVTQFFALPNGNSKSFLSLVFEINVACQRL